LNLGIFRN